jgi:hypothetical protein
MRLVQPAEHVAHRLPGVAHGLCALYRRPKFVVNGLPIHATEFRVPVRIAHHGPDAFERFDVKQLLAGRELAGGKNSANQNYDEAERAPSHETSV